MTARVESEKVVPFPPEKTTRFRRRLLAFVGVLSLVVGLGSFAGGAVGAVYTWNQATAQNIVTPDDAAIPETPVRGPFTMWAQSDIITHHQLDATEGLYYSEMSRQVPQVDEAGNPVIGEDGEPVMVPNAARASWINATALTTALSVGILAYALAAFAMVVGATLVASGVTFLSLRKALIA
ncbi:MAG TPA: hypothetical protein VM470_00670 [Acidimicrobiia bacterium]|nr:hypothetical protein [Acidimicrobiia bacterium]